MLLLPLIGLNQINLNVELGLGGQSQTYKHRSECLWCNCGYSDSHYTLEADMVNLELEGATMS